MAFMSVWIAWLPTLRWTKMAPGARPRIWLACFGVGWVVWGCVCVWGWWGWGVRDRGGGVSASRSRPSWCPRRAPGRPNPKRKCTYRHARVGASDPEVVRVLLVQQAVEELGVLGHHGRGPLPVVWRERERVVRGGTTGERRRARFGGAAAGVFGGRARACCVPPTWASVQRRKKARASGPLIRARAIKRAHEAPSKRDSWREKNRPSVEKGRAWHAPALSQAPTLTCWPRAAAPWGNGRSSRRRGGAPTRSSRARGARARAWSRGEKVDLGFGFFSARARAVAASWRGFLR